MSDILERLKEDGPWDGYPRGEAIAEIERLRTALEDVSNPMRVLQRHAEAEGTRLNGMAYSIANDLHFVQKIARDALVQ